MILTARLDVVAVMNEQGQPTPAKTTKVQAHKSLPFDVGAVIEMPARGETWITGVRSVRLQLAERTRAPKDFTVDWFWRQLGLDEVDATGPRDHNAAVVGAPQQQAPAPVAAPPFDPAPWEDALALADTLPALKRLWDDATAQHVIDRPLSGGESMRVVMLRTKQRMEQDAAGEDAVA